MTGAETHVIAVTVDEAQGGGASAGRGGVGAESAGAGGAGTEGAGTEWAAEVRRLAGERDAVILAHNYQAPEIQDVADHVGDSLAPPRLAARSAASVIAFGGVYFMAETAKIPAPARTVLLLAAQAGRSRRAC